MDRAGIALILSLLVPGVGQIYLGYWLSGIIWLLLTPGFWIGTGGALGWLCHLISAAMAYNAARQQR